LGFVDVGGWGEAGNTNIAQRPSFREMERGLQRIYDVTGHS